MVGHCRLPDAWAECSGQDHQGAASNVPGEHRGAQVHKGCQPAEGLPRRLLGRGRLWSTHLKTSCYRWRRVKIRHLTKSLSSWLVLTCSRQEQRQPQPPCFGAYQFFIWVTYDPPNHRNHDNLLDQVHPLPDPVQGGAGGGQGGGWEGDRGGEAKSQASASLLPGCHPRSSEAFLCRTTDHSAQVEHHTNRTSNVFNTPKAQMFAYTVILAVTLCLCGFPPDLQPVRWSSSLKCPTAGWQRNKLWRDLLCQRIHTQSPTWQSLWRWQ